MISPRIAHMLIVAALLTGVGWLDWITGYEVSVGVLYYAPIAYAAWHLSRGWSLFWGFLCAVTLTWVELNTGRHYSHQWMAWEHGFMRVLAFGFVAYSFSHFRATSDKNRQKIQQLEGLLQVCTLCHRVKDSEGQWIELGERDGRTEDGGRTPEGEGGRAEGGALQTRLCPICAREAYARGRRTDDRMGG